MAKEFKHNLQKMKDFFQHERIQSLIQKGRKETKLYVKVPITASSLITDKKEIEKPKEIEKRSPKTERLSQVPSLNLKTMHSKTQYYKSQNKENIKKKMVETSKDLIVEVKSMLTTFTQQTTEESVKSSEITQQQESFRKRLEKKRNHRNQQLKKIKRKKKPRRNLMMIKSLRED